MSGRAPVRADRRSPGASLLLVAPLSCLAMCRLGREVLGRRHASHAPARACLLSRGFLLSLGPRAHTSSGELGALCYMLEIFMSVGVVC